MAYTSARYDDSPMTGSVLIGRNRVAGPRPFLLSPSNSMAARIDWLSLSAHVVYSLSVGIPEAVADCLRFPSDQSREESRLRDCHPGDVQPHARAECAREGVSPAGRVGQDLAVIEDARSGKSHRQVNNLGID